MYYAKTTLQMRGFLTVAWVMALACAATADYTTPACPADGSAVFSQSPDIENWTLAFSDLGDWGWHGPTRFENFCELDRRIAGLRFWGLNFHYNWDVTGDNGWQPCVENPMGFEIKFYADAWGTPGAEVCSYTLSVPGNVVGQVGYPQYDVYEYDAVLDPPCALRDGWVSIRGVGATNCWFAWMSSADGDAESLSKAASGHVSNWPVDLALCLTADDEPVYGACCDDYTAKCQQDVALADCQGRFLAGGSCASFSPPCGQVTGACCLEDGTCTITTSAACYATLACPGDLDCDGTAWIGDINPFVIVLTQPGAYADLYPNCRIENADCNGDGVIDFGDINPFVALMGSQCPGPRGAWQGAGSTCAVCAPRRIICPADLPYSDTNATCGRPNAIDATCLDGYDSGSEIIYELVVTSVPLDVEITLVNDPDTSQDAVPYTGLLLTDHYPPDMNCIATSTSAAATTHGLGCQHLTPGTYYIMVDSWSLPACISQFELHVAACTPVIGRCCFDNRAPCAEVTPAVCAALGGKWTAGVNCTSPCPNVDGEDCGDAWPIPVVPFARTFDNTVMTADGPAAPCDTYGASGLMQNDAWFVWTASQSGLAVASAEGNDDIVLVVRAGCDNLTALACVNHAPNSAETVRFAAVAGQTYYFQVGAAGNFPGGGVTHFALHVLTGTGACCLPDGSCTVRSGLDCLNHGGEYLGDYTNCGAANCPQPTPGDNCANPIHVTLNAANLPYVNDNTTARRGNDYSDTCLGSFDSGEDIIYELNVTETIVASFTLDPHGTPYTGMLLTRGCPPDGECIAKSLNAGSNEYGINYVVLRPGSYTLMIDKWLNPAGIPSFQLRISNAEPEPAACCVGTSCANMTLAACLDIGGRWYRGKTCGSFVCPTAQFGSCDSPVGPYELYPGADDWAPGTTCNRGNAYAGSTCLGVFDGGQDAVLELDVSDGVDQINLTLSTEYQGRMRMAVFDACPPSANCLAIADENGMIQNLTLPTGGVYYVLVDMWPVWQGGAWRDCASFTLQFEDATVYP